MSITVDQPRRRLHPLSPVLRSARMLAVVIGIISLQGYAQLGPLRWLLVIAVVLVAVVILSVVSWWFTGYEVVGRELRIHEGLLWRRTRAIPLERLQAVDVVRPALARLAGLAELSLQVIGANKAEAPLAFLTVDEAATLRDRLLRLSASEADATPDAPVRPADPPPHLLHAVDNRDVLVSTLLTPQVWAVPVGVVFVGLQFVHDSPEWTFVGVASVFTALFGVLQHPIRRLLRDWRFRVSAGTSGLVLSGGLLETRTQTIPHQRVQAIGLTWPYLWRGKRWLMARVDVAGYGADEGRNVEQISRLLPVADLPTGQRIVGEVLPGVNFLTIPFTPVPARAKWVAPLARRVLGVAVAEDVFATTSGLVTRQLVLVPYARIQSVRVVQGPLDRRLRLATVHVDTAGALTAVAPHRAVDEAWALAAELADRAHAARGAGLHEDRQHLADR